MDKMGWLENEHTFLRLVRWIRARLCFLAHIRPLGSQAKTNSEALYGNTIGHMKDVN